MRAITQRGSVGISTKKESKFSINHLIRLVPHDAGRVRVFHVWREQVRQDGETHLRDVPNPDPHPPAQHVDRHDGQHVRHRHRVGREGVPEGVGQGDHVLGEVGAGIHCKRIP